MITGRGEEKMCSTTTCCLNFCPPSSPPTTAQKSSRASCSNHVSPHSWRSRGVAVAAAGLAYAMVGIGVIENLYFFSGEGSVVAEEMISAGVVKQGDGRAPARWSDRRACPPWKSKTFELIMPEKLPRPSPRRRWESVGDFEAVLTANSGSKGSSKCFSL